MTAAPSMLSAAWPSFLGAMPPQTKRSTAGGPRLLRERNIALHEEATFASWWKLNGAAMVRAGWFVSDFNGRTRLQQWLMPDGSLDAMGRARVARLAQPRQGALPLPEPELHLEPLPEVLESKLRPYQVKPARQLFRALSKGEAEWGYPGAVDFSDMGTGKTYMALAAALATGRQVVVLCPVVGRGGWERAFQHFGAEPYFIGTYEGVRGGNRPHIAVQVSDDVFRWQMASEIILILDEAQALRHDDTLNVKLCRGAVAQKIPIIVASATVAVDPREFRFAGRITGLHSGGDDWTRFLVTHGCTRKGKDWQWNGDRRTLVDIHARLFPRRGCRVRKQELGSDCPETEISVLPIECAEGIEIARQWEEAEEVFERMARTHGEGKAKILRQQARMKIWQKCELLLVPHIAARAKQDAKDGRSVALFVNFTETRNRLCHALNTKAGFFGGQPLKMRQYYERQFQENREFYLVSNIGAGGASVSLHDVTGDRPRTAYIFPTDHVVNMVQATGRVDRVGGKSKSLQYIPCVAGSVTEQMVQRTRQKMMRINTLNDGRDARRGF